MSWTVSRSVRLAPNNPSFPRTTSSGRVIPRTVVPGGGVQKVALIVNSRYVPLGVERTWPTSIWFIWEYLRTS